MSSIEQAEFERTPPHDIAAEQCVLGGMMLSKDAISDVIEVIRATDHYRPAHQIVHETILDLYGRGEPADALHHEARAGDNMRGSTALEGAATTILRVVKDGPRVELTNPKQKDGAEADPVTLWVVPRLQSVVVAGQPEGPTMVQRAASEDKILAVLAESFSETGACSTVLLDAAGLPRSTFHRALNRLLTDGQVQNLGSKTRTCYVLAQAALDDGHASPDGPR